MRRILLGLSSLALAVLSSPAAGAEGKSLRWDHCYSDGGVANRTFACDTNIGSERLVMSFVLDSPMADVYGIEARLLIVSVSPTLPSWWQFKNVGTCRTPSLSLDPSLAPGSVNCSDWANGNAFGGIASYIVGGIPPGGSVAGPNGVAMNLATAVAPDQIATLVAGAEYFAGSLVINHAKTVGAGACAGCGEPVCIALDRMRITTTVPANDRTLFDPAFAPDSHFAHWQNGQEANVQILNCEGGNFGCYHDFSCQLSATPTRGSTWGAVKALYR